MPTSYTSLLGLALPVTGELSGTWGDTVNDYITKYLDASVAGTQTISGSQTAVTLSVTNGTTLVQVGSGSSGSAQYNIINCTGNPAATLVIDAPKASKTYVVNNATSTNQSVTLRGGPSTPTTGVTLVAGEKAVVAWNGSDFIKIATSTADGVTTLSFGSTGLTPSTATSGAVTVAGTLVAANGGTGQSSYTTGDLLYATGSTALSKLGIGTNGQILTSTGTAPQWSTLSGVAVTTFSAGTTGFTPSSATSGAVTLAGTLATTNGGTGLTSFTANRVFYSSSTSAIGSSANLTFDGTTLTAANFADSSLTSGRVTYAGAGGNLTDSSNLQFDGSNLGMVNAPSAWGSASRAVQVWSAASYGMNSNDGGTFLGNNFFYNSSNIASYVSTAAASLYYQVSGQHRWFNAGSGTAGTTISFTQAMTLDASGQLLVGTTSNTGGGRIEVVSNATSAITTRSSASGAGQTVVAIRAVDSGATEFANAQYNALSHAWRLSNGTAALTLDASGNLLVGTTTSPSGSNQIVITDNTQFILGSFGGTNSIRYNTPGTTGMYFKTAGTDQMVLTSGGNLGVGTTAPTELLSLYRAANPYIVLQNSSTGTTSSDGGYLGLDGLQLQLRNKENDAVTFWTNNTERARITSGGKLGLNTTSPSGLLTIYNTTAADFTSLANLENSSAITINSNQATSVITFQGGSGGNPDKFIAVDNYGGTQYFSLGYQNGATRRNVIQFDQNDTIYFSTAGTERARITSGGQFAVSSAGTAGAPVISKSDDLDTGIFFPAANELAFAVNGVEELRITSAGFTRPVAYADTVSALGNTGTATTINLLNGNVFTATLTGNCTFTLSNAIATGSSSFTLILTNDGTAGRTVAWAGGSFVFPGGAASLSRTTTANAVDVWVFFTPNGGTTWYGNIAMKDMKA